MILTAAQIRSELEALAKAAKFELPIVTCDDPSYFLPALAWARKLLQYHIGRPWAYMTGRADCEDAAISARDDARKGAAGGELPSGSGFAFGIVAIGISFLNTINLKEGGSHKANIIRTPEGWYYYDRGTCILKPWNACVDDGDIIRFDSVTI